MTADPERQALSGIRVVDLTSGPCGGRATTVLADFGADVVHIEARGGDRFRSLASSPFWLRGKHTLEHDLDTLDGAGDNDETLRRLLAQSDVCVVDGPRGRLAERGLDADSLTELFPRLVHCTITGFGAPATSDGSDGPTDAWPGYEGIVAAWAGRMAGFGVQLDQDRPVFAALPVATHMASQGAVHGIVAALLQRERTGRGDTVETSLLQGLMSFDLVDQLTWQLHRRTEGNDPDRIADDFESFTPLRLMHGMPTLNYHPLRTSDGQWIQCGNLLEHLFMSFLDAIDLLGELLIDERFASSPATWTPEAVEEARDRILTRMQERTADEWMAIFDANGNVAAEPILTSAQAIDHRDIANSLVAVDDATVGATLQIGPIARLEGSPAAVRAGRGPMDTAAWPPLAAQSAEPLTATSEPASSGRPLAGITILDLSTIIAGPLGMAMLADLGARVIKVEPITGDPFRQLLGEGRMAVKTNAGKESICIDLKTADGQALVQRLVGGADVLVHNFRGDVPTKLGIDVETLHAINRRLIWAALSGYSSTSPSATRPATHPVIGAATGGVAYQAGPALTVDCPTLDDVREASRQIMAANDSNPDPNTSVVAASAILLALLDRERTGPAAAGQVVRIDMQTANAWANGDDFLRYDAKPKRPQVDDAIMGTSATYRLYPTADGWVFLAIESDEEFARFCRSAGCDGLADSDRFRTRSARAANDELLVTELTAVLATRDADRWQLLADDGIGCMRADGIEAGLRWSDDPWVHDRGWAPFVDHARFGRVRRWGPLTTVGPSAADDPTRFGPAPLAGQHTDTILNELGFGNAEIADLRERTIVTSEPVESE